MANELKDGPHPRALVEFAGHLAHELSHPLQNIANAADLFLRDDCDPRAREMFRRIIEHEIRSLTMLVGELRDIARSER